MAMRINKSMRENQVGQTCECCGFSIENEPYTLCDKSQSYYILGSGFVLYFYFLKYCIILLAVSDLQVNFFIFGLPSLITNLKGTECFKKEQYLDLCQNNRIFNDTQIKLICKRFDLDLNKTINLNHCINPFCCSLNNTCEENQKLDIEILCLLERSNYYQVMNIVNKKNNHSLRQIQQIFGQINVLISILLLHYFRNRLRNIEQEIDGELVTPSCYTAILRGLPTNYKKPQLEQVLADWCNQKNATIAKIVIAYHISEYLNILKDKRQLIIKKKKLLYLKNNHEQKYLQQKLTIEELDKELMMLQFKVCQFESQVFSGNYDKHSTVAFVTFMYKKDLKAFVKDFSYNYKKKINIFIREKLCCKKKTGLILLDKRIDVKKAPDPTDIQWEYCDKGKYKILRRIIIQLIAFIFFIIILAIFMFLAWLQVVTQNYSTISTFILFLNAILIVLFNAILIITYKKLVLQERNPTKTFFHISLGSKLIFAQIMNSGFLVMLANYLITKHGNIVNNENTRSRSIEKKGGLAEDYFIISLSNAFLTPIGTLLNLFYLYRVYMRRKIRNNTKKCFLTQKEANYWFEGSSLDMYAKYSHILKTILLTVFDFFIYQLGLFLPSYTYVHIIFISWTYDQLLAGQGIYGKINHLQYLFANRYVRPNLLSSSLNEFMQAYLQMYPIALAGGSFYFNFLVYPPEQGVGDTLMSIDSVLIFICILNFLFGKLLNKRILENKQQEQVDIPYTQAKLRFITDYDRTNPVTMNHAITDWIRELNESGLEQGKKLLQDRALKQMKKGCADLNLDMKSFCNIAQLAKKSINRIKNQNKEQVKAIQYKNKNKELRSSTTFQVNEIEGSVHIKRRNKKLQNYQQLKDE